MISSNFIFSFTTFLGYSQFFLTKLLRLGILFSTAGRVVVVVVAKVVVLGISFLTSFVLTLRVVLLATYLIYQFTLLCKLLKYKLLKLVDTFFNLSISILSILDFKFAKSTFFDIF